MEVSVQYPGRQWRAGYMGAGRGVTKGSSVEVARRADRLPPLAPQAVAQQWWSIPPRGSLQPQWNPLQQWGIQLLPTYHGL